MPPSSVPMSAPTPASRALDRVRVATRTVSRPGIQIQPQRHAGPIHAEQQASTICWHVLSPDSLDRAARDRMQTLASEFAITVANGAVWLAIGLALLLGAGCLRVRHLGRPRRRPARAPTRRPARRSAVGLASGLMVLAAWWAAIWSGGRSSFTPVAVGFAIAIGLALARRVRGRRLDGGPAPIRLRDRDASARRRRRRRRQSLILDGHWRGRLHRRGRPALRIDDGTEPTRRRTASRVQRSRPSTRSSARDLATTGHRDAPLGVRVLRICRAPGPDLVSLGRAVARLGRHHGLRHGATRRPLLHRPPVVLLAAAALTGTVVRRMARDDLRASLRVRVRGLPVPRARTVDPGSILQLVGRRHDLRDHPIWPWRRGGLARPVLARPCSVADAPTWALARLRRQRRARSSCPPTSPSPCWRSSGLGASGRSESWQSVITTRSLPIVSPIWRRTLVASGVLVVATVVWGYADRPRSRRGPSRPSFLHSMRPGASLSPSRSSAPGASLRSHSPGCVVPNEAAPPGRSVLRHIGAPGRRRHRMGCAARRLHDVLPVLRRDRGHRDAGGSDRRLGPSGST